MATFRIYAQAVMEITLEVEADSREEALEIAEDEVTVEAYVNDSIGIEYYADEIVNADVDTNGDVEWEQAYVEEV